MSANVSEIDTKLDKKLPYRNVLLIGPRYSGAKNLIFRVAHGFFMERFISTVSEQFVKTEADSRTFRLKLRVDNSHMRTVHNAPEEPADALLLVCDPTNAERFSQLQGILDYWKEVYPNATVTMAVTKQDLDEEQVVSRDEIEAFRQKNGINGIHYVSSKTDSNVQALFQDVAQSLLPTLPQPFDRELVEAQKRDLQAIITRLDDYIASAEANGYSEFNVLSAGMLRTQLQDLITIGTFQDSFGRTESINVKQARIDAYVQLKSITSMYYAFEAGTKERAYPYDDAILGIFHDLVQQKPKIRGLLVTTPTEMPGRPSPAISGFFAASHAKPVQWPASAQLEGTGYEHTRDMRGEDLTLALFNILQEKFEQAAASPTPLDAFVSVLEDYQDGYDKMASELIETSYNYDDLNAMLIRYLEKAGLTQSQLEQAIEEREQAMQSEAKSSQP